MAEIPQEVAEEFAAVLESESEKYAEELERLLGGQISGGADQFEDHSRDYQHRLSPYEKRVDFAAIEKVLDSDAIKTDLALRVPIRKVLDDLIGLIKNQDKAGGITQSFVQSLSLTTGPEAQKILGDYLLGIWRKGRELAIGELPQKIREKVNVKRFDLELPECAYCKKAIFHLPGQHDQCDHSPTGECAPEELESKERRLSSSFKSAGFNAEDTKAIKGYKDFGFAMVNKFLRQGDTGLGEGANKDAQKTITQLDAAFEKAPKLDEPVTVYRGFKSRAVLNNLDKLVGKTLDSQAFLSTSFDAKAISNFLKDEDSVGFRIKLSKGLPVIYTDAISPNKERELLLPRNIKVKINGIIKIGTKSFLDAELSQ